MKLPEQKKGKAHIKYINGAAETILSKNGWKGGCWFACIRQALKEHREYLIKCIEEQRRIEAESTKHCDDCGNELDADDIFHYVSLCHSCYQAKLEYDCSQRRQFGRPPERSEMMHPRMPGLCL